MSGVPRIFEKCEIRSQITDSRFVIDPSFAICSLYLPDTRNPPRTPFDTVVAENETRKLAQRANQLCRWRAAPCPVVPIMVTADS